jgi:hypothetical protein
MVLTHTLLIIPLQHHYQQQQRQQQLCPQPLHLMTLGGLQVWMQQRQQQQRISWACRGASSHPSCWLSWAFWGLGRQCPKRPNLQHSQHPPSSSSSSRLSPRSRLRVRRRWALG